MPFWRLYYHLVWATKNREHFVSPVKCHRIHSMARTGNLLETG